MTSERHRAVAALLLVIVSTACSIHPPDLNRVRFEYSLDSEYGDSRYKLTIWGNGKVRYESDRGFGVPGVQEYFVPQANVAAMVKALNDAEFFSMPETFPAMVFDCGVVRIPYSDGRRNKLVIDNCRESIPKLMRWQLILMHMHRQYRANLLNSKDMEPGLWTVGKELEHLAGAERFISPGLTDYALLVAQGWNVNTTGKRGWTALDYAVGRRDQLSARFLLEHGAAASDTALIDASTFDDLTFLKMLLGAPRISQNGLDHAVSYASRSRNTTALEMLLDAGASPNGDPRRSPIFDSVGLASGATIDVLVKHGADVNARDEEGKTPLIEAALRFDSGVVAQLIGLGANIDDRDNYGKTALMYASQSCYYWNMIPLLEAGAVPKTRDLQQHSFRDPLLCGPAGNEKVQRAAELLNAALKQAN